MKITNLYQQRPVRPLGIIRHHNWTIKMYSISVRHKVVPDELIAIAQAQLPEWLLKSQDSSFPNYEIAVLIIHEGRDGIFTLLNWWADENIIQNQVYFSTYDEPGKFENISKKGTVACVWELAVLWHERNAWIKHVLEKNDHPDFENYLNDFLNEEV